MPALLPTTVMGYVTWLGIVRSRQATLESIRQKSLRLTFAGPDGEDHGGITRPSCSRVEALYPRNTDIGNVRQLSILCAAEIAQIADSIGVDRFDPAWAGATMVIEGIPDFSHLPPASRLQFADGVTVTVDMINTPCHLPAAVIDVVAPGAGRRFKAAAQDRRGVTARVEREGIVRVGDVVRLFVSGQRAWRGPEEDGVGAEDRSASAQGET